MKSKITLLVATSKDGFIADSHGNGDFSSPEDKQQFRAFLRSDQCDCFACGRKTADEFKQRLTYKPLFILSSHKRENTGNNIFIQNIDELYQEMEKRNLTSCALLGGAETYKYFLRNNAIQEIRHTIENIYFNAGTSLNLEKYLDGFKKITTHTLSPNTIVITYRQKIR